jgi:hypothetical protein
VEVKEIASIPAANSAIFAHTAIKGSFRNGNFAHGAMDQDSIRQFLLTQLGLVITPDANTAMAKLCVLCAIVHGVIAKCKNLGRLGLSQKSAVGAIGLLIPIFGTTVPGANRT